MLMLTVASGAAAVVSASSAAAADTPPFSQTQPIDLKSGRPSAISCAASGLCLVVDGTERVHVRTGDVWTSESVPVGSVDSGLTDVTCLASGMCVAVGEDVAVVRSSGGTWTRFDGVLGDSGKSVTCASTTFCVTLGSYRYSVFDGITWSAPAKLTADDDPAGQIDSISCPTADFCIAVDTWGSVYRWDGTRWTLQRDVFAKTHSTVSCPDVTHCFLAAADEIRSMQGPDWPVVHSVTDAALNAISCSAPAVCTAVGFDVSQGDDFGHQLVVDFDGVTWSDPATAPSSPIGVSDLSCGTAEDCTVIDHIGHIARRHGKYWDAPQLIEHVTGYLTDVSCASVADCVAVDANGNAVHRTASGWQGPQLIDAGVAFLHVSCAAPNFCLATGSEPRGRGYQGVSARWNGSKWTTSQTDWVAASLSCPTSRFCMAILTDGRYAIFDGATWRVASAPNGISAGVDCTSSSFCIAGGWRFDGTSWTWTVPRNQTAPPDGKPSCATSSFCAVPGYTRMYLWDGHGWHPGPVGSWSRGDDVDCPATDFCIVDNGSLSSLVGLQHTQPVTSTELDVNDSVQGLSCPTVNRCVNVAQTTATEVSLSAPLVSRQPADVVTTASHPVQLSVAGAGSPAPEVQWQWQYPDGSQWGDVDNGTNTTVTVASPVTLRYRARLLNAGGAVYSRTVTVTVPTTPRVTSQPRSHGAVVNHATSFTVAASGEPTPIIRWQRSLNAGRSWTMVGSGARLSLVAKVAADYRAIATTPAGSALSRTAHLSVWTPPRITRQPTDVTTRANHHVTFTAHASGSPATTVRWQRSSDGRHWSYVHGAVKTTLTITAKTTSSGSRYRARFDNIAGSAYTRTTRLTVRRR